MIDITALEGIQKSSFAVLVGENQELKTLKVFKYIPGRIMEVEKYTATVEETAHRLICVPEPVGGVLVIGRYIISYHDPAQSTAPKGYSINPMEVTAHSFLHKSYNKCILVDSIGNFYILTLNISSSKVASLDVTHIVGKV